MSPLQTVITITVMAIGTVAGIVIVAQANPLRKKMTGSTRRLLRIVVALGGYAIVSRTFYQLATLFDIAEGTRAFSVMLAVFWALEFSFAWIAWRVWVDLRRNG